VNEIWYGRHSRHEGLKSRLDELVGWNARREPGHPLRKCAAYEVAYQTISQALFGGSKKRRQRKGLR
jgi:hypothetical protein